MIDSKELRQNNWLKRKFNPELPNEELHIQVSTIGYDNFLEDDCYINGISTKDLSPIPLTAEILEKCGFRQYLHTPGLYFKEIANEATSSPTTAVFIPATNKLEICRSGIGALDIDCPYLHTLQNFFALTQTELKVEL